jgi:hypothetical protein
MNASEFLAELLSGAAREIARGRGPVKWCRTCGRKHGSRAGCGLVQTQMLRPDGKVVARWRQPVKS